MNILHVIHDFLPRHRAGSEIYVSALARAQQKSCHDVAVLCADYDPAREHGHVTWRLHEGLPVAEIVNNWVCTSFADSYRPPLIGQRIRHALEVMRPDVIHVHNLLNLSFDLPDIARTMGIPVVATLHDYTLVCPSGGQRLHRRDEHVCHELDLDRCARCFAESPFQTQMTAGRVASSLPASRAIGRLAVAARRLAPSLTTLAGRALHHAAAVPATRQEMETRLMAAHEVFDAIDLFVAPSASIAEQFERLGLPAGKLRVSDYGFAPMPPAPRQPHELALRIGFAGTLVWHKGAHVLLDAVRQLPGSSWELKIFGSADTFPDYVEELRRKAAGLPVAFMGAFDHERTAGVYAQMDVLVVPSVWLENSPLVIHEAFMTRVPVVGARIGGIPDLVTDGVDGLLFDAGSPQALASALRRLIDRPGLLAELAERAPRVKPLVEDVADWNARYAEVSARRTGLRAAP